MFSSITKIADKNFVIGFLLPVVLATVVFLFLFRDTTTFEPIYESTFGQTALPDLTLLALAITAIAILLMLLNRGLYRMLEGYVWPLKREKAAETYRTILSGDQSEIAQEWSAVKNKTHAAPAEFYERWRELLLRFPNRPDLVLPTRFGNAIRAFETYSHHNYGAESIALWLRLLAVVPKEFMAVIDDARARVDFFVNTWFLAIVVASLSLARFVLGLTATTPAELSPVFPAVGVFAVLVAWGAYEGAVAAARAWGESVKTAFDLYLPKLANQLGYELPATAAERKRFWEAVTTMVFYWDPVKPEDWPQAGKKAGSKPSELAE